MADIDLSPWAHPKAQAWFSALIRRTHFPMTLENEMSQPDSQLTLNHLRMMLAFIILLGRKEIWPENERDLLKKVLNKVRDRIKQPPSQISGKPLSVAEHQEFNKVLEALKEEIEIVRRRVGISVRKTELNTPASWGKFWE